MCLKRNDKPYYGWSYADSRTELESFVSGKRNIHDNVPQKIIQEKNVPHFPQIGSIMIRHFKMITKPFDISNKINFKNPCHQILPWLKLVEITDITNKHAMYRIIIAEIWGWYLNNVRLGIRFL